MYPQSYISSWYIYLYPQSYISSRFVYIHLYTKDYNHFRGRGRVAVVEVRGFNAHYDFPYTFLPIVIKFCIQFCQNLIRGLVVFHLILLQF
jgi:hypothetical protein